MNSESQVKGQLARIAQARSEGATASLFCLALLLLPWLDPFASGPSSAVAPWLFSAVCAAIASGIQRPGALHPAWTLALVGLAAWAVLRSGWNPDTLALAAGCLLVYMAGGIAVADSKQPVRGIGLSWLLAAAVSTALALLQYFGAADPFAPWISASAVGEAFANLRQRNQFASLTVIGMASALWLFRRDLQRWPALVSMAWLAIGNAATTSRTGLAQMLVLGLLACFWPGPRRQRAMLCLAGLLAYLLAALALPWLLEATTGVEGTRLWERVAAVDTCSSRAVLWSNVLHLIAQRPWLGWGWGELDYAHFATLYDGPRFCDILDNAHSLPLHVAVELGVPAALLLCAGLLWATLAAKPWRETDPARQMAWAVLALMAVHSLLESPLWYGPFQIALGLCLGLLWPASRGAATPPLAAAGPGATRWLAAVAVGICIYAAWDYRRVSQIYLPPEARAAEYRDDPLPKIRRSWLFGSQARFAELTITPLTRANAAWTFDTARALLHYSPEPRVIEKLLESAIVLGRENEILLDLARFRAAFPEAYTAWSKSRARSAPAARGQPAT